MKRICMIILAFGLSTVSKANEIGPTMREMGETLKSLKDSEQDGKSLTEHFSSLVYKLFVMTPPCIQKLTSATDEAKQKLLFHGLVNQAYGTGLELQRVYYDGATATTAAKARPILKRLEALQTRGHMFFKPDSPNAACPPSD